MTNKPPNKQNTVFDGFLFIAVLLFLGLIVALLAQPYIAARILTARNQPQTTRQAIYPAPQAQSPRNVTATPSPTPTLAPTASISSALKPTVSNGLAYPVPPPSQAQSNVIPPTPNPNDPYYFSNDGIPARLQPKEYAPVVDLIIIGTVTKVYSARWTTVDGKRPANPFASDNKNTIYTPIEVAIVDTLKGNTSVKTLLVCAIGGQVSQDIVVISPPRNDFKDNDRVVLFLKTLTNWQLTNITMQISEYYKVDVADRATNVFQTIPVQEIRDQLRGLEVQPLTPVVHETSVTINQ